jgi:pyruvate formate lyase activating enzyme
LIAWNLDADGRCGHCGAACAGVFQAVPGNWGRRRQMIRVQEIEATRVV